jgi:hypothetical protein
LELIFNGENEFYNYRVSKNTADIENALAMQYRSLDIYDSKKEDMIDTTSLKNQVIAKSKRPSFTSHYYVHIINVFARYRGFEGLELILSKGNIGNLTMKQ